MAEPADLFQPAAPMESQPPSNFRLALTTITSREEAEHIAHALVERRLAACVNLVAGVTSVYRWQGNVEQSAEVLLIIKTNASCIAGLQQAIAELHSYQVPEFLVLAIESGSPAYLAWLAESLRQ